MARRALWAGLVVAAAAWSWVSLDLGAARIGEAPSALARLARDAWPPVAGPGGRFLLDALAALLETVQIAILATVFGATLSLPLAWISARTLVPAPLAFSARIVAAGIRVLPSLLWAILAVLVLGFGPLAGVAAMTFYTVGYLAKLQYEALEGVPRDALDAVRAMGATRFQQMWHVALPEAANPLIGQILFMFEYNVRAGSIVGLVGAGGIGQLLAIHLRFLQYDRVLTLVLLLFGAVALLDLVSVAARRRFVELSEVPPARWRDLAAR